MSKLSNAGRRAVSGPARPRETKQGGLRLRYVAALLAVICLLGACSQSSLNEAAVHDYRESNADSFQIDISYPSPGTAERERRAFEQAAARWSELIRGGLPDATVRASHVEQSCGAGYRFDGRIDDLLLFGSVGELDGSGGIVGMAGACLLRADGFPLVGVIVLDAADIDRLESQGNLVNTILHELGHVLDINLSGWQRRDLLRHDRSTCFDSRIVEFTGQEAIEAFARVGGSGRVPVENNGVMGTACSHWDEETFRSELMTGYLDQEVQLSSITAAALADMGYEVDMERVDDYSLPGAGSVVPLSASSRIEELLFEAGGFLDEFGNFSPL